MAIPNSVATKISSPLLNIMSYMEQLVLPQNYGLGAPGGDGSETFGSVVQARRNFKPFVVGILPPDVPINFVPFKRTLTAVANIQGTAVTPNGTGGSGGNTRQTLGDQFWINYVHMCDRLKIDPSEVAKVWFQESGFNPNQIAVRNGAPVAKGLNQITRQTGAYVGLSSSDWDNYDQLSGADQLPFIEKFMKGTGQTNGKTAQQLYATNFGGFNLPNFGPCYMSRSTYASLPADQQAQINKICGSRLSFMFLAYDQNSGLEKGRGVVGAQEVAANVTGLTLPADIRQNIANARQSVNGGAPEIAGAALSAPPAPVVAADDMNPLGIMVNGTTQVESDPSGDRIGKLVEYDATRLSTARRQTDALQAQIAVLQAVPGLLLMVNPSDFTRSFEPSVDNTVKGRHGNIVHVWLERPTVISFSGVTAGQYVVDGEGNGGVTGELRTYSASYLNLLSLLSVYKTNGIIYSGPEADLGIAMLGYSVFIYFDNFIYVGSFDSFEITDADQKPHNMAYSCRFNVRYYFDAGNDGRFTDFEIGVNGDFARRPQVSR
jgi:hypothetical protein